MQITLTLAVAALLGMLQEKENPGYKLWSEWKVGAWAKYAATMDQAGQKFEIESMMKLIEATPEKLVVETTGKMKMAGNEFATPPKKQEIKAREEEKNLPKFEKEGDEEIEVAGKKLKCHWVELTHEQGGKKMHVKSWISKEIPGGMARSEMTPEGGTAPMTKMQAVGWGDK